MGLSWQVKSEKATKSEQGFCINLAPAFLWQDLIQRRLNLTLSANVEGSYDPVRSRSYALLEVTAFDGDAFFVQVLAGAAGQGFRTRKRPHNGLLYTRINTEYDMVVYRKSVR